MTKEKYDDFWDNLFSKIGLKIQEENSSITFQEDAKDKIWKSYENYRSEYKDKFSFKPEEKIDRHKIATILLCAIVVNRPFDYINKIHNDASPKARLSTALFALYCGYSILLNYIKEELKNNKDSQSIDTTNLRIIFPPPITDKHSYPYILCQTLYKFQINSSLDTPREPFINHLFALLPHIFFFLETFSVQQFKKKLLQK